MKIVFKNFFISLAIIIFFSSSLSAQVKFEHLTVEDGLPHNSVNWITQDKYGFLWISTANGLAKYNGYEFTVFNNDPDDDTSISDRNVSQVFEDSKGNLWVGTWSEGLNLFIRETETFKRYQPIEGDPGSLITKGIYRIHEDNEGTIWIATIGEGLERFNGEINTFTNFRTDNNDPNSISSNEINSIYEDRFGNFWLGTTYGLNKFDRKTGKAAHFFHDPDDPESLGNNIVAKVFEDKSGDLWICTFGGLDKLERRTGKFEHFKYDPDDNFSISENRVIDIIEDSNGSLWVATLSSGLNKFSRQTGKFERYMADANDPESISVNDIRCLYEDSFGNIWIGGIESGLNKIDLFKDNFELFSHDHLKETSLSNNLVNSIYKSENILWIGTENGLNRCFISEGRFEVVGKGYLSSERLSGSRIGPIISDKKGVLWIGTKGAGLNRIDISRQSISSNSDIIPELSVLKNKTINALAFDASENLWVGTESFGLYRINFSRREIANFNHEFMGKNNLRSSLIEVIFCDSKGILWIGTANGLHRFNKNEENFKNYIDQQRGFRVIKSIFEDSKNRFWVGTSSGGLHLFDRNSGAWTTYSTDNGLPSESVKSIIEDDQGYLWIGTENGLSKFNPDDNSFVNYGRSDGLQGGYFNRGSIFKGKNGTIYIGGNNGFNSFHPERLVKNPNSPKIVFTDFKVRSKTNSSGFFSPLKIHINLTNEIHLSYKENNILIGFAALHFSNPEKNRYSVKLTNFESDWRFIGNSRSLEYTDLNPGEYEFLVKASNSDGKWSDDAEKLKIIISPPFWKTLWFRGVIMILILSSTYFIYRARIRTVEEKKKQLEIQLEEKNLLTASLQNALDEVSILKNKLREENIYLQEEIKTTSNFSDIICKGDELKKTLQNVEKVASTDATVLILGETGTGKELIARAIHNLSTRSERPLVKVNCAVLPENLIESELFGHEKGAFTGAVSQKNGRFEIADGGTIFLDEIGELHLDLQAKLLRVLQEGEFERLGGNDSIKVDVRVIAATNRNIEQLVSEKLFREDLYYRLNVFPIKVPPLRDRKEDIPLLINHFVKKYSQKAGKTIEIISPSLLDTLINYRWPGNIRELENVIERAVIISEGKKLVIGDWLKDIPKTIDEKEKLTLESVERQHIVQILEQTGWKVSGEKGAAKLLGINPKTLESRMKKLNIIRKKS